MPPYNNEDFQKAIAEYEKMFGEESPIGSAEVGMDEHIRLQFEAIEKGEPIRRSDYYPDGVLT